MMQSNYLCVILDAKHEKLFILTVFFLSQSKMAPRMASMFYDVIGLQQRQHP